MHPAVAGVLRFFDHRHLPPHLQEVVRPLAIAARDIAERAPGNPETTVALRHLLEAKDAAVRAVLPQIDAHDVVAMAKEWTSPSDVTV